ncbi:MAG TPA: RNA methyltransferase [Anaerolineae bacterium]|nr:RNA methyltransferase [Anaerolineae bacterium]
MKSALKIESLQNPRVKAAVRLNEARERAAQQRTLVEGYRPLLRAVENGYPLEEVYFCPTLFLGGNEPALLERAAQAGAELLEVTEAALRKMTTRNRPEGLLAVVPIVRRPLPSHQPGACGFYLIVERIERPGNLGTIFRSADAAGVEGIVICDPQTDAFNPEVIRASIGAVFSTPMFEARSADALAWCRRYGLQTVAATPHTELLYTAADFTQPLAIVVGAEKVGLSELWLTQADLRVRIPMLGQADSLNVATATTLLLYEVVRQRGVSAPPRS